MHGYVDALKCLSCGFVEPPGEHEYGCPKCGGIRDVAYDYNAIREVMTRESLAADPRCSVLRYLPLLPISKDTPVTPLSVGWTPVHEAPRLAEALRVARVWVKDDGRNPTASFKDRASFIGTARAAAQGRTIIAAASTGNAATSVAGLAASMGLEPYIFVPATAPEAKVAQLLVYGARVFLVEADYDRTYDLCQQAVARFGWYNRSAAVNPYLVEGKKTCGHEIAEQMAALGEMPDWVAMSVGDGCSIAATWKGMVEMKRLKIIDRLPKFLGVQAEGAAPLERAFSIESEDVVPVEAQTLADSINVGTPRNPLKALRSVRESKGTYVKVSDASILEWLPKLARLAGVFGEPTAVAAIAGVEAARAKGVIAPQETVLHVVTGNGLKDVKGAMRSVGAPTRVPPKLEAVERALSPGEGGAR